MNERRSEPFGTAPLQEFGGKAIPIPPGTRIRPKHYRRVDEPSRLRWWLTCAAIALAALLLGLLVGRFLLK